MAIKILSRYQIETFSVRFVKDIPCLIVTKEKVVPFTKKYFLILHFSTMVYFVSAIKQILMEAFLKSSSSDPMSRI